MPVTTKGKKIIEKKTGKVVGTATSAKNAKVSASIRNQAHRRKHKK
jgi:hypothetical protein